MSSARLVRDRLLPPFVSALGPTLVRALGGTWRVTRVGFDPFRARSEGGGDVRCIVALWHDTLLPLAFVHRGEGACVLVSRHGDGELIARTLSGLGFELARGSSTRGGATGLRGLLRAARSGKGDLAVTPDGPRGPSRRAKPGLFHLAALTGFPILPLGVAARPVWRFGSWDRFQVPKPFARVIVVGGELLRVERERLDERLPEWTESFERAMSDAERRAEHLLEGGEEA